MQRICEVIEFQMTEEKIHQYAAISNDYNPIHLSTRSANQAGFPNRVAHGMLSMAIGTKLISPMLRDSWSVQSYRVKFSSPLYINDTLTVKAHELTRTAESFSIKVSGTNQMNDQIISGKIILVKS